MPRARNYEPETPHRTAKYIKHLHIRGFVASRPIEGTSHMGFYITEEGKRYLEEKCGG
jgi:hypothetical protein